MPPPTAHGNSLNIAAVQGEARIRDLDLAARLGFERPRKIKELIERHMAALLKMGVCPTVGRASGPNGGRPTEDFYLNRKQAIFITAKSETPEATDITIEIIERFDAYERGSVQPIAIPQTLSEALRLAADQADLIERQKAQIAEAAPKMEAFDRIAKADGSMCITDAAKALQVRPKYLFGFLRQNGWIYGRPGKAGDIAYQDKIKTGYLEHKVTTVARTDGSESRT
ncbi:MAG TPA: phage antirepressor KilAC domain-containing protein [Azospirillaceae bacterium]|nr:phage antirepressor KilAC domain-containing protein [Azospirillaceae bacterium]